MPYEEAREYVRRFADAIGATPPTEEEFDAILELAGIAARSSARQAAPVTCWLAARAGLSVEEANDVAKDLLGRRAR